MNKRLCGSLLISAILLAPLAACSGGNDNGRTAEARPASAAETVPFTDSAGRLVDIPANITRISPSGALAQMFLLAAAPDLLVTIASEYAEDDRKYIPSNVAELPVVGQFYGSENLNLESVAVIGPEIIIDIGDPKDTIAEDMDSITKNLAVPAVHITAALRSTPEAFRTLGKILNREAQAEELAEYCERVLAQTDDIMARAGGGKISVLYCLGDAGLNVLAAHSFHSEVLDYVTDNRAVVDEPSSRGSGNETDLEQISLWNPEVIIFAPNSVYGDVAGDPVWRQIDAVKNGKYYEVPSGPYNWMGSPPSINRYLGMIWLTKILYPEAADFDLYAQTAEYYRLFYHYELSREAFDALTARSLAAN
ncbi:MAG: ABC transporter substrate-binding protein [Peptococcaceae bacterium]|jgi:iron complex transport system substrate-binding protein|nr:ABC transporter substrate-binding protein [Peptococcaceae bacterium]